MDKIDNQILWNIEEKLIENSNIMNEIVRASENGFIHRNIDCNLALKPQLLINDYTQGTKVLTYIDSELSKCDEFMISVAFITSSGVISLLETFKELEQRGIKGRIITTDYLNFSEPKALKRLLGFSNISIKVYDKESFHTKGYIFKHDDYYKIVVGSSNLTQTALTKNKEWNVTLSSMQQGSLANEVLNEFEAMWDDASELTEEWMSTYEEIYRKQREYAKLSKVPRISQYKLKPNKMQVDAMQALQCVRDENKDKTLLISATGTGKTYLSAFDMRKYNPRKALFIVHREQIARQALESYKNVFGDVRTMGILSGNSKNTNCDFLFSTVQTLSKDDILYKFHENEFEYIVIDEVHKAGAKTYQKIFNYFKPKFLLGMTATPERNDDFDIFNMFDHNIAYEIRLNQAMEEDILCPFHYFGITELIVDGHIVDDSTEFTYLVSEERVNNIIEKINFYGYSGDRVKGIVFCSTKNEARELSTMFNKRGYYTTALCGEDSQEVREEAVERLEQDGRRDGLDYIFIVDIFNEGIDIPQVNQVVMLRPTESSIIFVQQLGRGLRKSPNKEFVVIIDFIGNYTKNFLIPIALSGDRTYNKDTIRRYIAEGNRVIPGCSTVHFDEISRQRIYESINNTNFKTLKLLKEEYINLKYKLGRIPTLMDFHENGSVEPTLIIEYSKSYYKFLKKVENDYSVELSEEEDKMLEFISIYLSSGKRPHELLIVQMLMDKDAVSKCDIVDELFNVYEINRDDRSINKAIDILQGGFLSGSDKANYSGYPFIEKNIDSTESEVEMISRSKIYSVGLQNIQFKNILNDVIEYSLTRYNKKYRKAYRDTSLVLYEKYSRKDVCRLLNWKSDESSVMYGYKVKYGTCPIFVTYNKSTDISGSTKYEDQFIDKTTFSWMTRSRLTMNSPEVQQILNYEDNDLKIHLFVKKEDGEGRDFYYLGQIEPVISLVKQTTIQDDKGKILPIVNFPMKMKDPVREDLYDYITK